MSARIPRREAIKWMMAATATLSVLRKNSLAVIPSAQGYGTDPKLLENYKPGDLWPLTFSKEQHRVAGALCDIILPADGKSPAASELHVPDFIDEWISAPYPEQREDRKQILEGIDWVEKESSTRFKQSFADLTETQKQAICDDICFEPKARHNHKRAAQFFNKLRDLTLSAFYTTPEGMKDLQYIGNVPLAKFDGPPPEVLKLLKLE